MHLTYTAIMKNEIKSENKNIELMNCNETAAFLKVECATIYSWLYYNQLPKNLYRKLGRKPIFIREELIKWFLAGAELKKRKAKERMS